MTSAKFICGTFNQSINLFVQKCNTHWTGHQGRMQPPLTLFWGRSSGTLWNFTVGMMEWNNYVPKPHLQNQAY